MKIKKPNKFEIEIQDLKKQIATLQITCNKLDIDKEEVIRRNINLAILMNRTVKELSAVLHNITNDLPRIS